ncbi:MAG: asparagine synthetase B family protein, partial [Campylobacterota bacterium]|nr:asparagine synthetase B family protein [Campylobacterota bacterium]
MGIWCEQFFDTTEIQKESAFSISTIDSSGEIFEWRGEDTHLLFAIDGEIDNLHRLSSQLNLLSDDIADIVSRLYLRYGYEGLYRLEGAASIILHDATANTTLLYRLFLQGQPLYFVNKNRRLTISTNPIYLFRRGDVEDRVDEQEIAKLFAGDPTEFGESIFAEVSSVGHGDLIVIGSANSVKRHKRPLKDIFPDAIAYTSEKNLFEIYRHLLDRAASKVVKDDKRYGIMLSSGMDSSTIAYFLAEKLHEDDRELTAYSWEFPGDSADESLNIKRLADKLQIPLKLFNAEPFWTFDALENISLVPDTPLVNLMWGIIEENYRRASEDGADVLISGIYGDLLFRDDRHKMIKDIIIHKRFDIISEIWRERGPRGIAGDIKRFLISGYQLYTKPSTALTKKAKRLIKKNNSSLMEDGFENYRLALGPFYTNYLGRDRYLSASYGLERIEPYQDIELMNFSLNVPVHMTYRHGLKKHFTREAMRGVLPEEVLAQPRIGTESKLIEKSFLRNLDRVKEKIWENPSSWNGYIREEWMREKLQESAKVDNYDLYVIWLCIT